MISVTLTLKIDLPISGSCSTGYLCLELFLAREILLFIEYHIISQGILRSFYGEMLPKGLKTEAIAIYHPKLNYKKDLSSGKSALDRLYAPRV